MFTTVDFRETAYTSLNPIFRHEPLEDMAYRAKTIPFTLSPLPGGVQNSTTCPTNCLADNLLDRKVG